MIKIDGQLVGFKYDTYNVKAFSYCYENFNKYRNIYATKVPMCQKRVFDKFKMPLNQFHGDIGHGAALDQIIRSYRSDIYIFFDIDCIPIVPNVYETLCKLLLCKDGKRIVGIEQKCQGFDGIYAGPACFAISQATYDYLGNPSFVANRRGDVGQEFTHRCKEKSGMEAIFLPCTSSVNNKWKLDNGRTFGNGSTYADIIYHQFEIHHDENIDAFIKKCKQVLK